MASYSRELYSGKIPEDIPVLELDTLDDEITASYTGPDDGLAFPVREQSIKMTSSYSFHLVTKNILCSYNLPQHVSIMYHCTTAQFYTTTTNYFYYD